MHRTLLVFLFLATASFEVPSLRADDSIDPKAVVDKAIQALGGEANLKRYKAANSKTRGEFHIKGFGGGGEVKVEFTADVALQPPHQRKVVSKFDISGMMRSTIEAINGDKGWYRERGKIHDMDAGRYKRQREELYTAWLTLVVPLKDPAFKLTSLGESKVNDRPAIGIKVSREGEPDVNLYFDKENGLPAKSARQAMDFIGRVGEEETIYSDYKDFDGVKQYTKMKIKRDGKDTAEMEITEFNPVDKLDDKVFEKPKDE
jgi:hypothetical protein